MAWQLTNVHSIHGRTNLRLKRYFLSEHVHKRTCTCHNHKICVNIFNGNCCHKIPPGEFAGNHNVNSWPTSNTPFDANDITQLFSQVPFALGKAQHWLSSAGLFSSVIQSCIRCISQGWTFNTYVSV